MLIYALHDSLTSKKEIINFSIFESSPVETPAAVCKDQKPILAKVRPLLPSVVTRPSLQFSGTFSRRYPRQDAQNYPAGRLFFHPERAEHSGGVLASSTTDLTNCGTIKSPWIVEAGEGQSIQVTLVGFQVGRSTSWQYNATWKNDTAVLDVVDLHGGSLGNRCLVHAVVMETKYEPNQKVRFFMNFELPWISEPPSLVDGWIVIADHPIALVITANLFWLAYH